MSVEVTERFAPGKAPPSGQGLRIYNPRKSVVDAGYERMEWIMREFPMHHLCVSGGKDSTVILKLALDTAERLGTLPLKVYWLDQEAEWASTVELVRQWMYRDDVQPLWLQVPFKIFNASSSYEHWLYAWDPAKEDLWVHPRDPIALTENVYGTDRFARLFGAVLDHHCGGHPSATISGVRCEESPNRRKGLTMGATYKWVTWGTVASKARNQYAFYPIFDWSYRDVWKFILDNGLAYSSHYDTLYSYGAAVKDMRVSNLHHETAVRSLWQLQELEPQTYERLVGRISGIDSAGKFGERDFYPKTLPFMFRDWGEYRDYLLPELVDAEYRPHLAKMFAQADRTLPPWLLDESHRIGVQCIMTCDWEGVVFGNWRFGPDVHRQEKAYQAQLEAEGKERPR